MKTLMKNPFLVTMLIAALGLMYPVPVTAQTFTTLHSFAEGYHYYQDPRLGYSAETNSDGLSPNGGLVLSGNTLYGSTAGGSTSGFGTVYAVNTDGTGFTNVYNFNPPVGFDFTLNQGGFRPATGLILSGNAIYGTTSGGALDSGTIFSLGTDGMSFTNPYTFTWHNYDPFFGTHTNIDGASPTALILSGDTLYGATLISGISNNGSLFKVRTDGTGFTTLVTSGFKPTTVSQNMLYGLVGSGNGSVFAMNTDGTGFTILYSFTGPVNSGSGTTNSDGVNPNSLVLSGSTLYGTASSGGSFGQGTVFKLNTDGTGFADLYDFTAVSGSIGVYQRPTNSDGAGPSGLILSGNTLYGTASSGGSFSYGTVFALNTDGRGFTVLHSFTMGVLYNGSYTNSDGASPLAPLMLSGNTLYGVTGAGGSSSQGTVFSLSLPVTPPQLTLTASVSFCG